MSKICIYIDRHPRSKHIGNALYAGAKSIGWDVEVTRDIHYEPRGDILASYGWRNRPMFDAYKATGGHYLYIDLGYWGRKTNQGDYGGYHKVVLDDRHGTGYFQRKRPKDRLEDAPYIVPWTKSGEHIVLAGLSGKGAISLGFEPLEWELKTISEIRKFSSRKVVYRPKPSWAGAKPIVGIDYSHRNESIHKALDNAWLLVTHYSNAALDALAMGIPIVAQEGVASVMGGKIENIESPYFPDDREQFFADVGYCHWRKEEISNGMMFRQFLNDGLIRC